MSTSTSSRRFRLVQRMLALALIVATHFSGTAVAGPLAPAVSVPLACLILPDRTAELGSPVIGVIASVEVERGDFVHKGQILARLQADVERANTSIARSRADSQAELRGAESARDFALQQVQRMKELVKQNFMAPAALDKAQSDYDVANQHALQIREQLRTSGEEVSLYQAQQSQRVVRSPFDGMVVERYMNPGERVEDKPLLRLASISPLRVELVAPIALFGSLKLGQEASVQAELPGAPARNARIVQIDKVLDPASNTFRLRMALPNDDGALPAGLRCKVDLGGSPAHDAALPPPGHAPIARDESAASVSPKTLSGFGPVADRR